MVLTEKHTFSYVQDQTGSECKPLLTTLNVPEMNSAQSKTYKLTPNL